MNPKPKIAISIITPAYNAEQFIDRIYNSLRKQDFQDFEWIIIDDHSTDHTYALIQKITQQNSTLNITLLQNSDNLGVSASRNRGLDLAKGQYICFLDADDFWSKEKLSVQYLYMIQNNILMSYMDYEHVTPDGKILKIIHCPMRCTKNNILKSNYIGNLTCMIKKDIIQNTRFIKHAHEDYIFWLEILSKIDYAYKFNTLNPLCHYTVSKNSLSGNKIKAAKWQWSIYRNILKLNIIKSLYYFTFYAVKGLIKHKL